MSSTISYLDYCNSLLSGCPLHILKRLQNVQNSAARLVFKSRTRDHVLPLLQALHRSKSEQTTNCQPSVTTSSLTHLLPTSLTVLLLMYIPSKQLPSSADTRTLRIPHVKTKTFGQRSFSFFAPRICARCVLFCAIKKRSFNLLCV